MNRTRVAFWVMYVTGGASIAFSTEQTTLFAILIYILASSWLYFILFHKERE